jgi:hypothetical protein
MIGVAILAFIFVYGILPLIETKRKAEEEIALKRKALSKYEEYIRNRKTVEEGLDLALKQVEGIKQKLLSGETPQLGAASLQEIIKRLSEKNGIAIRSFRILEPKEMDIYRRVSIHIDFNPTNSLLSIGQFIYDIEHHEKELMIPEMDLVVFNIRMPHNMQGSIVISGWMKGPKIKEKGREG